MTTMTEDPYVHHVPTLAGGRDYGGVYNFYKNYFIGKMPKDFKVTNISRTIGKYTDNRNTTNKEISGTVKMPRTN